MMARRGEADGGIPDRQQRDLIVAELDRNLIVEAAAGTGKTTSMVSRMIAGLAAGVCQVNRMAAVTFTRKAAAELRARFHVALEETRARAGGEERERIAQALSSVEECFIGTIHSFCAHLLRERPVEAGVDLGFEEIEDEADRGLREQAWQIFTARLTVHDPQGLLGKLHELGLSLPDLEASFMDFADFPDVEDWPLPVAPEEGLRLEQAREELDIYVNHMKELLPHLPNDAGNDKLIPKLIRLPRVVSHYRDLDDPVQLMQVLEFFESNPEIKHNVWKATGCFDGGDAKREKERWDDFRDRVAAPNLAAWRERRYSIILQLLFQAREVYDDLRRERGVLNFQDLLMKAARLLRDNPSVRRYLQTRFGRILVDEFQDTDPIQAEVLMLLASDDSSQTDWRKCRPRPGSLFVVGDPKQSIYRFRRADITTYTEVKKMIERHGGLLVELHANFRADPPLLDWVNGVFEPDGPLALDRQASRFPSQECAESPAYVRLLPGPRNSSRPYPPGVFRLELGQEAGSGQDLTAFEAEAIARTIREMLDEDSSRHPRDFMIITRNTHRLATYARSLREWGIPCRVSGGSGLSRLRELRLLILCLKCLVDPQDPVALLALLRSELFGLSDQALYSFKKAGGVFSFRTPPPEGLNEEDGAAFADAFRRLESYYLLLMRMPALGAIESIAEDLGIGALAMAQPGGDIAAGGIAKSLELLRKENGNHWNLRQALEFLESLTDPADRHDSISVLASDDCVRVMNLHKAKGLEAPVVFLADPHGAFEHEVQRHIDRSEDKVRGYLAILGPADGNRRRAVLAHPANWGELSEKERRFLRAEELRLRYVAATRAACTTIISQRSKYNHHNPWKHFAPHLDSCLERASSAGSRREAEPPPGMEPAELKAAQSELAGRLDLAMRPGYAVRAAKDLALAGMHGGGAALSFKADKAGALTGKAPQTGQASEFGEAVHHLLHSAMRDPDFALEEEAARQLADLGFQPAEAEYATSMVRRALQSKIWKRAGASLLRLAEVPFQTALEREPLPSVVRGVIDLAFREDDGWVLVDYKTDRIEGKAIETAAETYARQMQIYAEAWERCSGQAVKEKLLYFLEPGILVNCW
jgi:ATP-dependent helicase/nuclease subunit A